jgi:hypothetical protein
MRYVVRGGDDPGNLSAPVLHGMGKGRDEGLHEDTAAGEIKKHKLLNGSFVYALFEQNSLTIFLRLFQLTYRWNGKARMR